MVNRLTIHASPAVFCRILPVAAYDFPQSARWRERTPSPPIGSAQKTIQRSSIKPPETDRTAAPMSVVGCRQVEDEDQSPNWEPLLNDRKWPVSDLRATVA
jgi:hypothetical protein